MTRPTLDTVAKWVKWAVVVGGVIFAAGGVVYRMNYQHGWLMHEICRVEIRMGMDSPYECTAIRGNATQASETAVVQR